MVQPGNRLAAGPADAQIHSRSPAAVDGHPFGFVYPEPGPADRDRLRGVPAAGSTRCPLGDGRRRKSQPRLDAARQFACLRLRNSPRFFSGYREHSADSQRAWDDDGLHGQRRDPGGQVFLRGGGGWRSRDLGPVKPSNRHTGACNCSLRVGLGERWGVQLR